MRKTETLKVAERPKNENIVPLDLGEQTYRLTYNFDAIVRVEKALNTNLLQPLLNFQNISATAFLGLFSAALAIKHPKLTMHEVGALIAYDKLAPITNALVEVYVQPRIDAVLANAEATPDTAA